VQLVAAKPMPERKKLYAREKTKSPLFLGNCLHNYPKIFFLPTLLVIGLAQLVMAKPMPEKKKFYYIRKNKIPLFSE